jgi:6-phosphogluconolactonase
LVANFASGSVSVLPIREDGSLTDASGVIQHDGSSADPVRQSGPHAHSVTLDASNRFAYIPDLGLDKLMIYSFDSNRGKLKPHAQPWFETKPGAGPRHFMFHPNNNFAYLINELDSTIVSLGYDRETGTVEEIQTVPALPESFGGQSTCADIHVDPSGRFLFGSNRGHDSIDQQSGRLTPSGQITSAPTPVCLKILG